MNIHGIAIAQVELDGAWEHLWTLDFVRWRFYIIFNLPRLLIHREHDAELGEYHAQLVILINVVVFLDEVQQDLDALLLRFTLFLQIVVLAHELRVVG